tara:strand:- start:357 stop:812 length:456 start_codon:yes stop_codon:yes gene_type:complete
MAHKYEEELEILKERICRDVRESIKEFLNADPEQGMHYDLPLEKQFAEACEDIADRISNMSNNLHYKAMDKQITRAWMDAETIDRLKKAFSKIHGSNWKDAFTCEVPEKDFKLYDDACEYHTGASLQKVSVCDGIVQCYCDGYYHAMDGWT